MKQRTFYKGLSLIAFAVVIADLVGLAALGKPSAETEYAAKATPVFNPHAASVSLEFTDGFCSGTIYLDHTILTAEHCVVDGPLIAINAMPAKSLWRLADKTDHVFVVTDQTFQLGAYPTVRFTNGLLQGTNFTFYGNPIGLHDQYRQGYVTGTCDAGYCFPGLPEQLSIPKNFQVTMLSVMGQHGDSGAGIYNDARELVGVVSLIQEEMPVPFVPMGALPFTFTQGDLATVALMNDGAADAMAPAP